MRARSWAAALAVLLACAGGTAAAPADQEACLAANNPAALLKAPSDPELYDYVACTELATGRTHLCDYFPGGPRSKADPARSYTVVRADGRTHDETLYGVCVSRAAGHRFLQLLVAGAPESELLPQMRRMLYGEDVPAEQVVRAMVHAWRTQSLKDSPRPELARLGFFDHLLGKEACRKLREGKIRQECFLKAAAIEAIRAKDASRCLTDDFLCRELVQGPAVCGEIAERIAGRRCVEAPASPPPAKERPPGL